MNTTVLRPIGAALRVAWRVCAVFLCLGSMAAAARAEGKEAPAVAALDPEVELKLRVLAGHPDIKPGIAATKVAAWAWSMQHVIEEYDADRLRVNLTLRQGRAMLPYGVEYTFSDGLLVSYAIEPRERPPALEEIRRRDRDAMPWIAVDRSLWGYAFRIAPTWRLLGEEEFPGEDSSFRFTVIALPKIYDDELDAWIENSLQWCVFRRDRPFAEIDEVIAAEEQRLEQMGTQVVRRGETEDASGFLYETVYQDNRYLGKTYFLIADDGAACALRFNATAGTFAVNLPRFERFAKGFVLTRERIRDPDIELIRKGDTVLTIVGGAFTAQDLEGLQSRTVIPGSAD